MVHWRRYWYSPLINLPLDKTLKRGISHATDNVNIVSQARSELIFIDSTEDELQIVETPVYTFILPDLTQLEGKYFKYYVLFSS